MSKYINSLMQISAASVVMASAVFAEQPATMSPPQSCMMGNLCAIYPTLNNGYNVHLDIGYLLEQFVLTGTDNAYTTDAYDTDIQTAVKTYRPTFNVASGLVAELGYYFEHDNWFLNFHFDWASRTGHEGHTVTSPSVIVPTGVYGFSNEAPSAYSQTKGKDKLNYFMLNLDLNRGTYLTGNLAIEPHAGVKAAWIYYDFKTTFVSTAFTKYVKNENNFWGIGPDFGLNTTWYFTKHFSAFSDLQGAVLCGGVNARNYTYEDTATTYSIRAVEKPIAISPTVRGIFGFQYNLPCCDNSQNFRFRLACDSAYYWNQNATIKADNSFNKEFSLSDFGGLGMMGFFVDIGWDF